MLADFHYMIVLKHTLILTLSTGVLGQPGRSLPQSISPKVCYIAYKFAYDRTMGGKWKNLFYRRG